MRTTVWYEQSKLTGRYSVRYYDPVTGKKVRVLCETFRDVQKKKAEIGSMLTNKRLGKGMPDASPLLVFGKYLEAIATTHRASTLTLKKFAVEPFLKRVVRMANVTPEAIEAWKRDMMAKYKRDTTSLRLRELRAFVNWCVKNEYLPESPFKSQIPSSTFVGRRATDEELDAIVAACSDAFKPFFILAVETGARRGELLGMDWSEVDLEIGAWSIPAERCKTKYSRTVPLSDSAVQALRAILGPENLKPGSGPVFMGLTPSQVRRLWEGALKRAGISGRLRIHDLRHTFASRFRGRWTSLKMICGWRSDSMASHYTHTTFQELKEDMAK